MYYANHLGQKAASTIIASRIRSMPHDPKPPHGWQGSQGSTGRQGGGQGGGQGGKQPAPALMVSPVVIDESSFKFYLPGEPEYRYNDNRQEDQGEAPREPSLETTAKEDTVHRDRSSHA